MLPHGISGSGQDIQYCPVTQFLGQLLRLLVCPNEKFGAQIQKNVKELVAYEMSPALYPILFDQIKIIVEKFFDGQSQVIVNDTNTQVIFPISRSFNKFRQIWSTLTGFGHFWPI